MNKVAVALVGIVIVVAVVAALGILLMNGSNTPSGSEAENAAIAEQPKDNAVVTISYGKFTLAPCGTEYMVAVSIKNSGYPQFTPSISGFKMTTNGVSYNADYSGTKTLGWVSSIADGGSFEGSIAFEVAEAPASFTLAYSGSSDYNIVCQAR